MGSAATAAGAAKPRENGGGVIFPRRRRHAPGEGRERHRVEELMKNPAVSSSRSISLATQKLQSSFRASAKSVATPKPEQVQGIMTRSRAPPAVSQNPMEHSAGALPSVERLDHMFDQRSSQNMGMRRLTISESV